MSEKLPITVLISTLNAGEHLEELFDSILPYVEDVFITDSRSIDDTVDICLRRGVKIVQRPFKNCGEQCQWSMDHLPIKTDWVFVMAQDERFSDSLVADLRRVFAEGIPDGVDGYTVKWRLWFMGQPLHATADNFRLMRKGKCRATNVACNEHFVADGKVLKLEGILEHKDTLNLHQWYEKQNLWTTMEAVQRVKPPSEDELPKLLGSALQRKAFLRMVLRKLPGRKFVKFLYYFLKFGAWRDGHVGFVWAALRVWVSEVVELKADEMRNHGVPVKLPEGRHGTYDPRILASSLQKQLLPETMG